ncbi:NAD(P)H-binding protein [Qipengyuania sp. S6317L1]|uniref:NAD(P)-dependent oxidoreductase n=1 Tax=Qipengyuania sp. S6317L1 TaxID=2926410 RepID=UPI001FF2FECC|nr:NAD(P)H-binding protein [Qipengyuania sp. S6317L1]MCK0098306.1 NAD(P)H-binding protein [Qipengyuania sp. S6317L1]
MQITVFGATGRVGSRVVDQAAQRGFDVKAISHNGTSHAHSKVTTVQADVLKDDLTDALEGSSAVVSCLGVGNDPATLFDPPPLYTKGTLRIAGAMKVASIDRLIVVSATFVETLDRGPAHFQATLPALSMVFKQMEDMEAQLTRLDNLRWTAVRPGWIMDADPSPDAVITDRVIREDLIRSRTGDIAKLMLDAVENDQWINEKPAVASPEDDEHTSVKAVVQEIV